MRISHLATLLVFGVLVGEQSIAVAGAATDCVAMGGTMEAGNVCHVHSAASGYTMDLRFPTDYADEQAVLRYRRMAIEKQRVSARDARIPCHLILSDGSDYPFEGYIDFVSNRLDPATGTLEARGVFPNPDRVLESGMFARMRIAGSGPRKAILVADQAIGTNQNQRYVLVVGPDNKVKAQPVTVGNLHDGDMLSPERAGEVRERTRHPRQPRPEQNCDSFRLGRVEAVGLRDHMHAAGVGD